MNNWIEKYTIDFGVWYSGMEREKVKRAYDRFVNETQQPLPSPPSSTLQEKDVEEYFSRGVCVYKYGGTTNGIIIGRCDSDEKAKKAAATLNKKLAAYEKDLEGYLLRKGFGRLP